jgi:Glycosyl hydrolases family 16
MKQYVKNLGMICLLLLAMVSCEKDDYEFGDLNSPSGIKVNAELVGKDDANPNGDGSGLVNFTATSVNGFSYKYIFSDGTTQNSPSGVFQKRFTQNGTNTYSVTVLASGRGGMTSSLTFEVTVFSNFSDDEAVAKLTGGSTKTWYWAAAEPGHLGVGQNDGNADLNFYANYYQAAPFEKAGAPASACLYEAELKFSLVNGQLQFEQDNKGHTFFNAAFQSVVGGSAGSDNCYDFNTTGIKNVQLGPSSSVVAADKKRGTEMTFSDGGFMGYYIGQTTYEILSITDNRLYVRAVMGGNPALAWYHIFTTTPPVQNVDETYDTLVWSDEFNVDGAPDPTHWGYDLGAGGWGNNEVQTYTNDAQNVSVSGGNLKITLRKVGANYTSARLNSKGKYDFKYGKVEFRAKLPTGGGTWPALWMLGANIDQAPWPACGEIDVMEHVGNQQDVIFGTLHYPGNSGGNANSASTNVPGVSNDFHTYSTVWSPSSIKIYVDGNLYHSVPNTAALPFNANFFLIMNVAMGGNFGGAIAPGFTQSTMEVDYVKVYQ